MIVRIDTLDDPRLDAYARLTEAQLRSKLEPERALLLPNQAKLLSERWRGPATFVAPHGGEVAGRTKSPH